MTGGAANASRKKVETENIEQIAEEIKEEYQAKRTEEEKELIKELVESGRKVKEENIVTIAKSEAGGIIWMETGNKKAGLIHILERHRKELKDNGIDAKEIPQMIADIAINGEIITGTISSNGQKGVLLKMGEKKFIVSIGNNGFIVGCYPIGERSNYAKTSYEDGLATFVSVGLR